MKGSCRTDGNRPASGAERDQGTTQQGCDLGQRVIRQAWTNEDHAVGLERAFATLGRGSARRPIIGGIPRYVARRSPCHPWGLG